MQHAPFLPALLCNPALTSLAPAHLPGADDPYLAYNEWQVINPCEWMVQVVPQQWLC